MTAVDPEKAAIPLVEDDAVFIASVFTDWRNEPHSIHYNRRKFRNYSHSLKVAILAHEYGHVLTGVDDDIEGQARCDRWTGCTLAVLGLTDHDFVELLRYLEPEEQLVVRVAALRDGAWICRHGRVALKP